jgi:hypothetical protein
MSMMTQEKDLPIYAGAWAGGVVVLGLLMHVGRLPGMQTRIWVRLLLAAFLSLAIVLSVWGVRALEQRSKAVARTIAVHHGVKVGARTNVKKPRRKASLASAVQQGLANASALVSQGRRPKGARRAGSPAAGSAAAESEHVVDLEENYADGAEGHPTQGAEGQAELQAAQATHGALPQADEARARLDAEQAGDEAFDRELDRRAVEERAVSKMVGGVRTGSFAARVMPRRVEAAKQWAGTLPQAGKLAEIVAYEGMRDYKDSTLYAREAYKTHQWNEPGEGMDQRYVDPSLTSYDSAFVAYSDQPYIPQRSTLSGRAPAHF